MSPTHAAPAVLDERSLPAVARYMQSDECKHVFVMTGAGISTSAGIPDFRSPDTGLYANLARLRLPYPEAVFDIHFFRKNPLPFYTLAHELAPGRFRPTIAHSFIRLLHEKKLLHTCFTQNIDTLERRAGLPGHRIIEAHGSFANQRCIDCKVPFDADKMKQMIRDKKVPKCEHCRGLVKPDIVFFGENLPPEFHRSIFNLVSADLLIILGTSLTVHPFASLTGLVPETCPRVLINLDEVGDIGSRPDDVIALGRCDEVVRQLARLLDWEQELDSLWDKTKDSLDSDQEAAEAPAADLEAEVKKLADQVEKTLNLASELGKTTDVKQGEALPSKISRGKPTGMEETKGVVEKTTEGGPSGVAEKATDEGPSGVAEKITDEGPSGVAEKITDEGPSGVAEKITDEGPSGVAEKTTEEGPSGAESEGSKAGTPAGHATKEGKEEDSGKTAKADGKL